MTTEEMPTEVLGKSIKRVEDRRLITGKGRFVDDINLAGTAHMAILRSPYAHANIKSIDTSIAKTMPGVVDVLTGADVPYNPLPMAWPAGGSAGIQNNVNTPRALATDSVKWNGEGVAAVIAETPEQAADAVEAIIVDWEPLPAVVDAEKATQKGAPQLHENAPNNVVFEWSVGDKDGTAAAIDGAEVVVKQRLINQRLIPNPMETRGDIGWYNPGTDEYTIWMSSQTPHIQRLLLAAFVMGVPEHKIRCISPDVGGAFGTKIFCYADYVLVLLASKRLNGRPVKWIEGRRENYQSTSTVGTTSPISRLRASATAGHRSAGQDVRQPRWPAVDGRPGDPDHPVRPRPLGLLQDPERLRGSHGGLHEHRVRRCLPGRGPAGGDVRHRAGNGPVRERDRHGQGRDPAAELHRAGPVPVRESVGARDGQRRREDLHRLRQLRAGARQGAGHGEVLEPGRGEGRGEEARQAPRVSASPRTSRSAASRHRSGSAPSARAGARRCGSRRTSRST